MRVEMMRVTLDVVVGVALQLSGRPIECFPASPCERHDPPMTPGSRRMARTVSAS
jgi:hypothetical protein